MHYPRIMQPTHARWEQINDNEPPAPSEDTPSYPPINPIYSRNYLIVDTYMETAPSPNYGVPGPDGAGWDLGPGLGGNVEGMSGLCGVSQEILDTLPEDCRKAFEEEREKERMWKGRWKTESVDGARRDVKVDKGLIL